MTPAGENCAKLERLYGAFESGGPAAAAPLLEEVFHPDVEFFPIATGEAGGRTYRGRDGVGAFFGELHEQLREVSYDPPDFHPVGEDLVIAFTRLAGLDRRSSAPVRQDLALVYEFRDGMVLRVESFQTPAEALEAAQRGHADA